VRALVQRVTRAEVTVDGESVGQIGPGLCAFVGVTHADDAVAAAKLARRLHNLRIFEDQAGVPNRSAADLGRPILVVSQFTLYADTSRGRRPSYIEAAGPEQAEPLINAVVEALRAEGASVETGRFRAEMAVELVNDGPFTILLET
jgi:D-tyrosyl-tRNA(Tyr) deacylase